MYLSFIYLGETLRGNSILCGRYFRTRCPFWNDERWVILERDSSLLLHPALLFEFILYIYESIRFIDAFVCRNLFSVHNSYIVDLPPSCSVLLVYHSYYYLTLLWLFSWLFIDRYPSIIYHFYRSCFVKYHLTPFFFWLIFWLNILVSFLIIWLPIFFPLCE